jgi:hypothetical protein
LDVEWEKRKNQRYDLEERLLEYSVRIMKIVEQLPNTRAGNHVAGQLLRSGTSPYPNHGEAQAAESPKDFIHKLRISLKELRFNPSPLGEQQLDISLGLLEGAVNYIIAKRFRSVQLTPWRKAF